MAPPSKQARRTEVAVRYRRRIKSPGSVAALRIRDITRLFRGRHGHVLPDTDNGRRDVATMAHHLAALPGDPRKRLDGWLQLWAPWLSIGEAHDLLVEVIARPRRWKADTLAWRLRLTDIDRTTLGITTIGSVDVPRAARIKRRRERNRLYNRAKRQAAGAVPRAEYLAKVRALRPWEAAGMSRATWYRQRRET